MQREQLHHAILRGVFEQVGLDPSTETPGRLVVRHLGESLVAAMTSLPEPCPRPS